MAAETGGGEKRQDVAIEIGLGCGEIVTKTSKQHCKKTSESE